MTPIWVAEEVVLALHEEQLAEHGGAPGVKDMGLLQSALARPRNRFVYEQGDVAALAAVYAVALARNHAFNDGNKRVSLVATETFLRLNGLDLTASDEACFEMWLRIAEGSLDESSLADWIRQNIVPVG